MSKRSKGRGLDEYESNIGTFDSEMSDASQDAEEDESDTDTFINSSLPVLESIVKTGKIGMKNQELVSGSSKDAERETIKQELALLSFEELQKLKEKLGSKKFYQTLKQKVEPKRTISAMEQEKQEEKFKRANKNRPREISSKSRKIEAKNAIQVQKVFKNDPRFDSLCGEFNEKKFNRNYEFISKMKENEVEKLKEELKEESNPKRIKKIKFLIQRMENQIRSEKQRKEEEIKQMEEKQMQIDAMNDGKSPYFASKSEWYLLLSSNSNKLLNMNV